MEGAGQATFAEVILPVPLQQLYTYRIPPELQGQVTKGKRVVVQFGKSKIYTAVVFSTHYDQPLHYRAKDILEVLDANPVINDHQFALWQWISDYYLCTLGEIFAAALPAALKLQSETLLTVHPGFKQDEVMLTHEEQMILDALQHARKGLSVAEAARVTGRNGGLRLVRSMLEREMLVTQEEIREQYVPRQISYLRMTAMENDEAQMKALFGQLERRAPKQLDALLAFMRIRQDSGNQDIPRHILLKQNPAFAQAVTQLVKKGVLELFDDEIRVDAAPVAVATAAVNLSETQQAAFDQIQGVITERPVTLLFGVTASGKTEIYIRLIQETIAAGKQVLYLLPEIALTTQIIHRLRRHFGEHMLVYHSRFSGRDRAEAYMKISGDGNEGKFRYPIIVGARSAVFLPFSKLGLIIVDEEHDGSYKQQDPAPRYHARDTAVVLGQLHGCHTLLGSATPSLESFYNAKSSKYALVKLSDRYGGARLPDIQMVDLRAAYQNHQMKSHFSATLLEQVRKTLAEKEQVILFQNRRGFAPVLECKNCAWVPQCVNCDVSLTYHKKSDQLRCHYCGYSTRVPVKCLACGHADIRMKGMGTERIEDEISIFFPDHRVERLDLDTTDTKSSFQRILAGFETGEIDILVGTQMVTKGLDFDRVGLVGVINADALIRFPDFRAAERSFQLLSQVAGRSGRRQRQGRVYIQSYNPTHPVLGFIARHDYESFFRYESEERQRFAFPPHVRLIQLRLKARDEKELAGMARHLAAELRAVFGKRVQGPVAPPVARIRNFYLQHILIKIEKGLSNQKVKTGIGKVNDRFLSHPENRRLIIQVDVDPG